MHPCDLTDMQLSYFPTLTPDEAGHVVCEAIVARPRRFSPAFGRVASFADSITPEIMDYVRNKGFTMFPDSAAAKGRESGPAQAHEDRDDPSVARRVFVEFTNGNHW